MLLPDYEPAGASLSHVELMVIDGAAVKASFAALHQLRRLVVSLRCGMANILL